MQSSLISAPNCYCLRILPRVTKQFGMWFSARLSVAIFLILACTFPAHAAFRSEKLRASGAALADALLLSRKQPTSGGVHLAQQQIHNPRSGGAAPPAEEGARLPPNALALPHCAADKKPGGRSGPPDETTVFLNMLPVVIPCIFVIAILIVVIALRYFNAIAEQTPEGARVHIMSCSLINLEILCTYHLILSAASYFDANVKGVPRREDVGSFARVGKRF